MITGKPRLVGLVQNLFRWILIRQPTPAHNTRSEGSLPGGSLWGQRASGEVANHAGSLWGNARVGYSEGGRNVPRRDVARKRDRIVPLKYYRYSLHSLQICLKSHFPVYSYPSFSSIHIFCASRPLTQTKCIAKAELCPIHIFCLGYLVPVTQISFSQ